MTLRWGEEETETNGQRFVIKLHARMKKNKVVFEGGLRLMCCAREHIILIKYIYICLYYSVKYGIQHCTCS